MEDYRITQFFSDYPISNWGDQKDYRITEFETEALQKDYRITEFETEAFKKITGLPNFSLSEISNFFHICRV